MRHALQCLSPESNEGKKRPQRRHFRIMHFPRRTNCVTHFRYWRGVRPNCTCMCWNNWRVWSLKTSRPLLVVSMRSLMSPLWTLGLVRGRPRFSRLPDDLIRRLIVRPERAYPSTCLISNRISGVEKWYWDKAKLIFTWGSTWICLQRQFFLMVFVSLLLPFPSICQDIAYA